jgi:hypothetical protein
MRLLFIGRGGSGKTHLARYFRRRGKKAIDGDAYPGLSRWEDLHGNVLKDYDFAKWNPKSGVDWFWNPKVLKRLAMRKELYLFGYARNTLKYVGLFDKVYLLDVNERTRRKRLKSRRSTWGKAEAHMRDIIKGAGDLRKLSKRMGFNIIDTSMPPKAIFEMVEADRKASMRGI